MTKRKKYEHINSQKNAFSSIKKLNKVIKKKQHNYISPMLYITKSYECFTEILR